MKIRRKDLGESFLFEPSTVNRKCEKHKNSAWWAVRANTKRADLLWPDDGLLETSPLRQKWWPEGLQA